ncbi:hypothetical protein [Sphingobacterium sp.]|uniref:hypothetical protein n=1 Tax=Sphingobacterium sp. TaxID=341027 RepID=UPI0028AFB7B2|nr:hypothetical protein [Sphingobacterium sp.]
MKSKQEVIQEAWVIAVGVERYESIKDELVLDGFLHFQPSSLKDTDTKIIDGLPFYRPKSLAGIETNNNWIRIESDADLPKEDGDYFVVWKVGDDVQVSAVSYDVDQPEYWHGVTHYQAVIKPLPPIY